MRVIVYEAQDGHEEEVFEIDTLEMEQHERAYAESQGLWYHIEDREEED